MNTDANIATAETIRTIVREELIAHAGDRPPEPINGYLTVEDVTQRLRIGKTTLWQLRRNGKIRGYTVGRRVLFRPEDVDALVERGAAA